MTVRVEGTRAGKRATLPIRKGVCRCWQAWCGQWCGPIGRGVGKGSSVREVEVTTHCGQSGWAVCKVWALQTAREAARKVTNRKVDKKTFFIPFAKLTHRNEA